MTKEDNKRKFKVVIEEERTKWYSTKWFSWLSFVLFYFLGFYYTFISFKVLGLFLFVFMTIILLFGERIRNYFVREVGNL